MFVYELRVKVRKSVCCVLTRRISPMAFTSPRWECHRSCDCHDNAVRTLFARCLSGAIIITMVHETMKLYLRHHPASCSLPAQRCCRKFLFGLGPHAGEQTCPQAWQRMCTVPCLYHSRIPYPYISVCAGGRRSLLRSRVASRLPSFVFSHKLFFRFQVRSS